MGISCILKVSNTFPFINGVFSNQGRFTTITVSSNNQYWWFAADQSIRIYTKTLNPKWNQMMNSRGWAVRKRSFRRPFVWADIKQFDFIVACVGTTEGKNFVIDITKCGQIMIIYCTRMICVFFAIVTEIFYFIGAMLTVELLPEAFLLITAGETKHNSFLAIK